MAVIGSLVSANVESETDDSHDTSDVHKLIPKSRDEKMAEEKETKMHQSLSKKYLEVLGVVTLYW
jgi:hypothetical protein